MIFAIDQFKFFLTGRKFLVRTDNAALSWLKTQKDPKGILMRWLRILSTYEFDIQHRAGTKHGNADALSRASHAPELSKSESAQLLDDDDQILVIESDYSASESETDSNATLSDENPENEQDLNEEFEVPENYTSSQIVEMQKEDEILSRVINWVQNKFKPTGQQYKLLNADEKFYADYFEYLDFDSSGILIRKPIPHTYERDSKIALPVKFQECVLQSLHCKSHSSGNSLSDDVKLKYTFPRMVSICRDYVLKCLRCQRLAKKKSQKHTYAHDLIGAPNEKICIDFVGPLSPSSRGHRYLLTVVDVYTRWFEAWPIKKANATTVIKHLIRDYIPYRGIPSIVHSDNGMAFVAEIFKEALNEFSICKTFSPAYNPKSNTVERFHRTLKRKLTALMHEFDQSWDEALPAILFSMRTSVNKATGYTPFYLEHGREARLPIDLVVGSPPTTQEPLSQYVTKLKQSFQTAYSHVAGKQNAYILRQRELYKEKHERIRVDDLVWLYTEKPNPRLGRKFAKYWVGPFKVLLQVTNVMFKIESYGRWTKDRLVTTVAIDRLKKCYSADPDTNLGIPVNIKASDVRPYYEHQELLGRIPISDFAPHIFSEHDNLPHTIPEENETQTPLQVPLSIPNNPSQNLENNQNLDNSHKSDSSTVTIQPGQSVSHGHNNSGERDLTPIVRGPDGKVIPPARVKLKKLPSNVVSKYLSQPNEESSSDLEFNSKEFLHSTLNRETASTSTASNSPLWRRRSLSKYSLSSHNSALEEERNISTPSGRMGITPSLRTPVLHRSKEEEEVGHSQGVKREISTGHQAGPSKKISRPVSTSSSDASMKSNYVKTKAKSKYGNDPSPQRSPTGKTAFCNTCISLNRNCPRHCPRCKENLKCREHSVPARCCTHCTAVLKCPKHCSQCTFWRLCRDHQGQ